MIDALVEQIETRFSELEREMSDPEVISDRQRYAEVGREYRELQPAHELAREYVALTGDLEGARELLEEGEDAELRKVVEEAPPRLAELEEEIRLAMVERDPNDDKNVLVEIRAGTGGTRRRCSPATSTRCSPATPKSAALRPRCSRSRRPRWGASRR